MSAGDTVSRLELELRRTSLLRLNFLCNRLVPVQSGLRERQHTKTKREPEQKQRGEEAAKLPPNKSHATASLISKVAYLSFKLQLDWYWTSILTVLKISVIDPHFQTYLDVTYHIPLESVLNYMDFDFKTLHYVIISLGQIMAFFIDVGKNLSIFDHRAFITYHIIKEERVTSLN